MALSNSSPCPTVLFMAQSVVVSYLPVGFIEGDWFKIHNLLKAMYKVSVKCVSVQNFEDIPGYHLEKSCWI